MKKRKIGLVSGILVGLFLAGSVLGAVGYVRTPSGYTINNPVSFEVIGVFDTYPTKQSYKFSFTGAGQGSSDCFTENNKTLITDLNLGTYTAVGLILYPEPDGTCDGGWGSEDIFLELDAGNPIFEVVEGEPPPPVFFEDMGGLMTGAVAMAGTLFTDLAPVLIAGLGVSMGLVYVIPKIITILKDIT